MRVHDILMAPTLLKDIPMLSSTNQTFGLEAFHSVLLHFLPKTHGFSDAGMRARTQLAILHYNENADRVQLVEDGAKQYRLKPSKVKKTWLAVPLKENATHNYTVTLTNAVLSRMQQYPTFESAKQALVFQAQLAHSTTYGEKPTFADAVKQHRARFNI
ncbi:uncharacterized protein LOC135394379 [Ornithodoros turicata]|uniref:uncharacterized protein LOC135394379 n=1 Tax=Ornithodoros turicata TaxID=34597 RepID=UPI003138A975